jgi:hypothetical protein
VQSVHCTPALPQASDDTPETHVLCPLNSVQQPEGQVIASQPVGWMLPQAFTFESQKSKPCASQSLHAVPLVPHVLSSVPSRQVPDGSQHPVAQVAALQIPLSMGPSAPPSPKM